MFNSLGPDAASVPQEGKAIVMSSAERPRDGWRLLVPRPLRGADLMDAVYLGCARSGRPQAIEHGRSAANEPSMATPALLAMLPTVVTSRFW